MARKKKRGCLGMILGIGMSAAVVVVLGMVGTYGLKWERSYEKRNEIPYQKVNLKETNPAQKYYYESLSEEDKVVYQQILQGVLDGNGEIYLHSADAKKNNQLFQFVLNDYPEIFWCDGRGKTTIYQKGTESYSVLNPEYQYGQEERERKQKEIDAITQEVLDGAPKDGAEYEKIQYVYEYVINHTDYREGASDNQNIYSVLVNGESVCAGYARTTQYLLERLNVFCTYVTGTAKRPESSEEVPHAWNLVSCGEDYYYVDTTWGDPVYLEEVDTNIVYDYLCISEEELFQLEQIRKVVDGLPAQCRIVFTMSCLDGKKYKEIAEELQISVNTVKSHVLKAYREIREHIVLTDKVSVLFFWFFRVYSVEYQSNIHL